MTDNRPRAIVTASLTLVLAANFPDKIIAGRRRRALRRQRCTVHASEKARFPVSSIGPPPTSLSSPSSRLYTNRRASISASKPPQLKLSEWAKLRFAIFFTPLVLVDET